MMLNEITVNDLRKVRHAVGLDKTVHGRQTTMDIGEYKHTDALELSAKKKPLHTLLLLINGRWAWKEEKTGDIDFNKTLAKFYAGPAGFDHEEKMNGTSISLNKKGDSVFLGRDGFWNTAGVKSESTEFKETRRVITDRILSGERPSDLLGERHLVWRPALPATDETHGHRYTDADMADAVKIISAVKEAGWRLKAKSGESLAKMAAQEIVKHVGQRKLPVNAYGPEKETWFAVHAGEYPSFLLEVPDKRMGASLDRIVHDDESPFMYVLDRPGVSS